MGPGQRAGSGKAAAGYRSPRPSFGWYGEWMVLVELLFCLRADVRHGGIWLVGGDAMREIGPASSSALGRRGSFIGDCGAMRRSNRERQKLL